MKAQLNQIHTKNATISYSISGNGNEPLLLFHGFGQDKSVFATYLNRLKDRFTIYSFDLLFHGLSQWHLEETPITKEQWATLLSQFLKDHGITNFSVLGFSLGAKFALAAAISFPTRINTIFLLAPDGIRTNTWYSLATYPILLRKLFKSMIDHPNRFFALTKMAKALKLVDSGVVRFAQSQMASEAQRKKVYYSWVVFRQLKFNQKRLAHVINLHGIILQVFIGKFDKLITTKNVEGFLKKIPNSTMHIVQTGHNGLIAESMKVLVKYEAGKAINSR